MRTMLTTCLLALTLGTPFMSAAEQEHPMETAIVAAGCFWGVEDAFAHTEGVTNAESGYIGGTGDNPTYRLVCTGTTNHAEAVRVTYDPQRISYTQILDVFWNIHDATQVDRQGPDHGSQYRSAIFALDENQLALANHSKAVAQKYYSQPIATQVQLATTFWPAEDYHQDYMAVNGGSCHTRRRGLQIVTATIEQSNDEWKQQLGDEQFRILRQAGTEAPFGKAYTLWKDEKSGYARCAGCELEIFDLSTQFESGCGWPSFDKALPGRVTMIEDTSHGMVRTEVRCYRCGGHLGHLFDDGPTPTGKRFCINGGALIKQ
jgi:peptide methionine sulfoxide reductase msrA/msrB